MIQRYLANELRKVIPGLRWSSNYYTGDEVGAVYHTGGFEPSTSDLVTRRPTYQVWIRSRKWDYAEQAARIAFNEFHKKEGFTADVPIFDKDENVVGEKSYYVFLIAAAGEPIRIGVENGVMEYSVNFDTTIKELEEA